MDQNKKIDVAILGATGTVGQQFITLLDAHPWFNVAAVAASERSAGRRYGDVVNWIQNHPLPPRIAQMTVGACTPEAVPCRICFSGLDSSVAGETEKLFAQAGRAVISNSKNHRMEKDVPLMVPEVNSDHLDLIVNQNCPPGGMIITNPNCAAVGLVMALKPLLKYAVEAVHVVTLQAVSGAGFPGVASLNILDNVIPFIEGEEDKIESEPQKILGNLIKGNIEEHPMKISAQCTRVPVIDGHTECVSIKLKHHTSAEEMIAAWNNFKGLPQEKELPSAPAQAIFYCHQNEYPQPRRQRLLGNGMTVSIGRLRPCSIFDWKFVLLSHNTIRGAAGCAILNAELLVTSSHWSDHG